MREFSHVFNDSYLRFQDNDTDMDVDGRNSDLRLLAIPTNQKAREDLVAVGDHIEAEKDRLLNVVSLVLCVPSFLLLVDASYPAPSFWQMKIQSKEHDIIETLKMKELDLETMIDHLPENRVLYKDSGLWMIINENDFIVGVGNPLYEQAITETFTGFIKRCFESENTYYY